MALVVIGTTDGLRSTRSRMRHGPEALRVAARRVSQDLHMIEILGRKAICGDGLSPEVRAAVGEAFLLHVWSLREFFYGNRHSGNGVVAADYFRRAAEWESVRPPLPTCLEGDWHRLSGAVKPVSRVEPDRSSPDGRCPYHRFTRELAEVTRRFLLALPPDRTDWFGAPA